MSPSTHLFPCYKLPLDVQENVVRFMEYLEIIQTSLVSPKFRVAVRRARIKMDNLSFHVKESSDARQPQESFHRQRHIIKLSISYPLKQVLINFFWQEHKKQVSRILKGQTRVKIREDLWMGTVGENILIYNSNPKYSKLADYQFILDALFETFAFFGSFYLGIETKMSKEIMFPLALRYRNSALHTISLNQSDDTNNCANLTSSELSALLDGLKAPKICLDWNTEPGVKFTGVLRTKSMHLGEAHWFTIDHLMTCECETLYAKTIGLTALDLNSFVQKWQEGGFEKLKHLCFHNIDKQDWLTCMDGIEGTVSRGYEGLQKEISRSDGKAASIIYSERYFVFVVTGKK